MITANIILAVALLGAVITIAQKDFQIGKMAKDFMDLKKRHGVLETENKRLYNENNTLDMQLDECQRHLNPGR